MLHFKYYTFKCNLLYVELILIVKKAIVGYI